MESMSGQKTLGADKEQASCQAQQESRKKRRSRRKGRRRQRREGEGSESSAAQSAIRQQQVVSESTTKTSGTTTTTVEAQYSTRKTSSSSTNPTTKDITDSCNIQTNLIETPTIPDLGIAPPSSQQHRQQGETLVVTLQDKNNNFVDTTQTHIQSIQQTPTNPSDQLRVQTTTTTNQSSVNAVRVLFQDQHHQQQQLLLQQRTNLGTLYGDRDNRAEAAREQQSSDVEHPRQPPVSASVINLNRQLIERQLEAIQAADSERWNFDFRQSRPLRIEGHRYQVVQCPRPSCRTLNERSDQDTGIRFCQNQNNQQRRQHQERLPTGQGNDCKHTHRDRPDHKQDDARQ